MKAIKLIYLADRLHLRKYGRPIIGDMYWAMKLGPVGSLAKRVAELTDMPEDALLYAKNISNRQMKRNNPLSLSNQPNLICFQKPTLNVLKKFTTFFRTKTNLSWPS